MTNWQIYALGATVFIMFPGYTIMAILLKGLTYYLLMVMYQLNNQEE